MFRFGFLIPSLFLVSTALAQEASPITSCEFNGPVISDAKLLRSKTTTYIWIGMTCLRKDGSKEETGTRCNIRYVDDALACMNDELPPPVAERWNQYQALLRQTQDLTDRYNAQVERANAEKLTKEERAQKNAEIRAAYDLLTQQLNDLNTRIAELLSKPLEEN